MKLLLTTFVLLIFSLNAFGQLLPKITIKKDDLNPIKVVENVARESTKGAESVIKTTSKAAEDITNVATEALNNTASESMKMVENGANIVGDGLEVTKDIIEVTPVDEVLNETGNLFGNVANEMTNGLQKTGAALEAAAEPKNILKQAIIYTASAYGGPMGAAFANALCDKLIYNKDMTEADFLKSITVGAASGYASEYVTGMNFNSEYARSASSSIARSLAKDGLNSAVYNEDYSLKEFINSVATGAVQVEIESAYINKIAETALENAASQATSDIILEGKVNLEKLDDAIYESIANGLTENALNNILDNHVISMIPEEHKRLDLQYYEELKFLLSSVLISSYYTEEDLVDEIEPATPLQWHEDNLIFTEVVKPPFSSTPLGQSLSYNSEVCEWVESNPTPGSYIGGNIGYTRNNGTKYHNGFDETSNDPTYDDLIKYTGTKPGKVLRAGKSYTKSGEYLGYRVEIELKDNNGDTWVSRTMHHKEVLVKPGQRVTPGQIVAKGSGIGDAFKGNLVGKPHIHWDIKRNGYQVDPLSGTLVEKNKKQNLP